jgi:hypothetical protein
VLTLEPQTIAAGEGTIELNVTLPEGYKVNDRAPFSMQWLIDGAAEEGLIQFSAEDGNRTIIKPVFPLSFSAAFGEGDTEITADLVIYYCEAEAESLCFIERVRITIPITISSNGSDTVIVPHTIEIPS